MIKSYWLKFDESYLRKITSIFEVEYSKFDQGVSQKINISCKKRFQRYTFIENAVKFFM